MGDCIDADMEADENSALMDVRDGSGVFALNLAFTQIFFAGVPVYALDICLHGDVKREWRLTLRIRTRICSPTWNRSVASPIQSHDRSRARMEHSVPKISTRTTFSATAITLACNALFKVCQALTAMSVLQQLKILLKCPMENMGACPKIGQTKAFFCLP